MTEILRAKPILKEIYARIRDNISLFKRLPQLEIIQIGKDPAAELYVDNLQKKGDQYGIRVNLRRLSIDVGQQEIETLISELNGNRNVDGIMLQKPLPEHLDESVINSLIKPEKDVDGFHPVNLGKLVLEQPGLLPCTPQAVIAILKFYQIETIGKRVVILGRSNIVGKPLGLLLLSKKEPGNATVTFCHSQTENLASITREADILIAAIGKPRFVKTNMIKDKAVVIDVGTNLISDAEKGDIYVGDVDFEAVQYKTSAITPVPGGVGSITTALLLLNVITAAKLNLKK